MKWTEETPTKEGYYWARDTTDFVGPRILHIIKNSGDNKLYIGEDTEWDLLSYYVERIDPNLEWYGPIKPPKH